MLGVKYLLFYLTRGLAARSSSGSKHGMSLEVSWALQTDRQTDSGSRRSRGPQAGPERCHPHSQAGGVQETPRAWAGRGRAGSVTFATGSRELLNIWLVTK